MTVDRELAVTGASAIARERLKSPRVELVPFESVLAEARRLPPGSTVTVTASPTRPIETTIRTAEELADLGFSVVPHLAARTIRDRKHLAEIVSRLQSVDVRDVFVIGGDGKQPEGDFASALQLMVAMGEVGGDFDEIGIAGYPGGHPVVDDGCLLEALREKSKAATYLVTQICFEPAVIAQWLEHIRAQGIALPVHIGIAGAVELPKLLRTSLKIGVGDSIRVLRKQAGLTRLLRPTYDPDVLVDGVSELLEDPARRVIGFHIFTFNQVGSTERWRAGRVGSPQGREGGENQDGT